MNNSNKFPLWNNDRIKYIWNNETLRIGGDDVDVTEIHGHTNFWLEFITLCNGCNEEKEIFLTLKENFDLEENEFNMFLNQFKKKNFIEVLNKSYNDNEYNKFFESPVTYFSSEGLGGQNTLEILQEMKVTILGCGGGGSHIALQLAQFGVGNIHLVDDDHIELKNINRQSLFSILDIGKYKVDITKKYIVQRNPHCIVTVKRKQIQNKNDLLNEIKNADWVFCCMDFPPYKAQRIVNNACHELGIPSVYCFSQRSAGKLMFVNPLGSACLDCLLTQEDTEHFQKLVSKFIENDENLITANTLTNIWLLTSWICKKWLDVITNDKEYYNCLWRFDFNTFSEKKFQIFQKNKNCPTCGMIKNKSPLWEVLKID